MFKMTLLLYDKIKRIILDLWMCGGNSVDCIFIIDILSKWDGKGIHLQFWHLHSKIHKYNSQSYYWYWFLCNYFYLRNIPILDNNQY